MIRWLRVKWDKWQWDRFVRGHGTCFGYPPCCIKAFCTYENSCEDECERDIADSDAPWVGTGFMPCKSCAQEILQTSLGEFVSVHIDPRRTAIYAFPNERYDVEERKIWRDVTNAWREMA